MATVRCPRVPMPGETREEYVQAMTQALARSCRVREAHRAAFDAWAEHVSLEAEARLALEDELREAERGGG